MDWRTLAEPDNPEINQLASAKAVPLESASATDSQTSNEISSAISSTEAKNVSVTEEPSAENSEVADAGGDNQMESVSGVVDRVAGELAANAATTPATESVASTTTVDESAGSESTVTNAAESNATQLDEQQPDPSAGEASPVISAEVEAQMTPAGSSRFQRDIRTSLEWIDGRPGDVGTLQIMLLTQERFDEHTYYDYIDRLARQGVDTSQIRILKTLTVNKKLFSVVYGEYQNRGAARVARADLPNVLRETSPIPRSVGALKEEMRRLESQN